MNFVDELRWRGMVHDLTPGTEEYLAKNMGTAYVGIDPTADSLHIGHLVSVMILKHFQRCGHRPIALVGGATGMIGDPSGKSAERNLLDEETLRRNQAGIKKQLSKLLYFGDNESIENAAAAGVPAARMVNNYDWMRSLTFLDFIRDIGKLLTVNYMMAKDSVKKRFSGAGEGMSFTEFTYQLVQGFDFLHLYETADCRLQLGGSDQWGNITTGIELIRRKLGAEAYGLTCPLIKKADGTKFGKTESGNIWLSADYTSPYRFYQFWLNTSDEDAASYIKIFTMLGREDVDALIAEQAAAPHLRPLQRRLAQEVTTMIHSGEEYEKALAASQILFGSAGVDELRKLDEATFLDVFDGVPTFKIAATALSKTPLPKTDEMVKVPLCGGVDAGTADGVVKKGCNIVDLLVEVAPIFPSKGELRKLISGGGVSLNKEKVDDPSRTIGTDDLISGKYLLVQKGKKNYYLIIVES